MTSKNSFSKLVRDGMRRNLWAIVLSGIAFFFTLLLPTLMGMQNSLRQLNAAESIYAGSEAFYGGRGMELHDDLWNQAIRSIRQLTDLNNPLVKAAFIILAVVCGVAMFAYLHSRQKVDFYHSLPISRTKLFLANFVTGILCAAPMYFVMLLITYACVGAMGFGAAIDFSIIANTIITHLVCFLIIYAITVLTTVLCGNTIITLLLLIWAFFSPLLIKALQIGLFSKFFTTFMETERDFLWLIRLSPVVQYFAAEKSGEITIFDSELSIFPVLAVYFIIAVLVTLLACWLFKIRKSERSGTALAFEPLKLPLKVYMCLIMGASFGLLFHFAAGEFWFWPGLVLGTVIFHAVVEIIYAFDFKAILSKPVHMGIILAVLAAAMLSLKMDVFRYNKCIPSVKSIAAVDIDDSHTSFFNARLSNPDNIQMVRRLAEIGIENLSDASGDESAQTSVVKSGDEPYWGVGIMYRLSSGRNVSRKYFVPINDEVKGIIERLTGSEEFKRANWGVFTYEEETEKRKDEKENYGYAYYNVPCLKVYNGDFVNNNDTVTTDKDKIMQLLHAYQEDCVARTETYEPVLRLSFGWTVSDNRDDYRDDYSEYTSVYVTEKDVKTLALLKELLGAEHKPIPLDKIEGVRMTFYGEREPENVEVTDKADVQKLMENVLSCDGLNLYTTNNRWSAAEEGLIYTLPDREYEFIIDIDALVSEEAEDGGINIYNVGICWPADKFPADIVEKYAPSWYKSKGLNDTGESHMETSTHENT